MYSLQFNGTSHFEGSVMIGTALAFLVFRCSTLAWNPVHVSMHHSFAFMHDVWTMQRVVSPIIAYPMQALMTKILKSTALVSSCDLPFDIGRMWKGESGPQLKEQLQVHFQNITSIMDCVGCEKCKLWGKLQFLGVATALKILFASDDCFREGLAPTQVLGALNLERNEVIALINLLTKLAHSVETYREMAQQLQMESDVVPCVQLGDSIS